MKVMTLYSAEPVSIIEHNPLGREPVDQTQLATSNLRSAHLSCGLNYHTAQSIVPRPLV